MEHQEMYLKERNSYLIIHFDEMPAFLRAWNTFSMLNGEYKAGGEKTEDLASFTADPSNGPGGYLQVTITSFEMMARTSSWLFHLGQMFEMMKNRKS